MSEDTKEKIPETMSVQRWHLQNLGRLGISTDLVSEDDELDWHEVEALLERGCPPHLAVRIVR